MANTFKFGNGEWAVGKETVLAYNDENNNFKPLPFSFDRGSIATVVNSNGLIETVGVDEPRIDFLNNTKGHLLLEPSRQNKLLQSNQFDTTWTLSASITLTSGQTGVGNSSDAWLLKRTGSGARYIQQTVSATASNVFSFYAKADTTDWLWMFNGTDSVYMDVNNGVVGTISGATSANIESVGNGWYRCSMVSDDTISFVRIYPAYSNGNVSTGTDNGIYIQYAQLEEGSYATSYIPTSGSAVTRSAETIEQQTFLMEGLTDMAMFVDYELPNDKNPSDFRNQIGFRDNSNANFYLIQFSNSEQMEFRYRGTAGVNVDMTPTISEATYGLRRKILYTKTGTTLKVFCNGVEVSSVTNSNATTFSSTTENLHISNNYPKELNIRDWRLYNNGLTDQEAIALTTI